MDLERAIVQIIANAGESRSKALLALEKVKDGDYEAARALLEESREADLKAHNSQTELIQQELRQENKEPVSLLMVHAQDHYMSSQLVRDIVGQLVDIFEARDQGNK